MWVLHVLTPFSCTIFVQTLALYFKDKAMGLVLQLVLGFPILGAGELCSHGCLEERVL